MICKEVYTLGGDRLEVREVLYDGIVYYDVYHEDNIIHNESLDEIPTKEEVEALFKVWNTPYVYHQDILKEIVIKLRESGVKIDDPYDFENWIQDHASHSQLFDTGLFYDEDA